MILLNLFTDTPPSIKIMLVAYVLVIGYLRGMPYLTQSKRDDFVNHRAARRLTKLGLVAVDNEYRGYYQNYFFRVFQTTGYYSQLCVIMYYRPLYNKDGRINTAELKGIEFRNGNALNPSSILVRGCSIWTCTYYDMWFGFWSIKRAMNRLVKIGLKENLIALTEEELKELLKIDANYFR